MRQRISRDLHDDIGSTLSSINIYSNLAKEEKDNTFYIDTIQQYTQNIINNLDDLVWSINPKNDGIATMVDRMRSFAEPVLAAKGIRCRFTDDVDYNLNISLEKRNSLFLAYKEMVNNVLKHSNCSSCNINFCTKGKTVSIAVEDDGEGFSMENLNGKRNGLKNLDYRAKQLNGKFIINSEDGKGTRAELHARI
jgi:signal transduction histidine kinase